MGQGLCQPLWGLVSYCQQGRTHLSGTRLHCSVQQARICVLLSWTLLIEVDVVAPSVAGQSACMLVQCSSTWLLRQAVSCHRAPAAAAPRSQQASCHDSPLPCR